LKRIDARRVRTGATVLATAGILAALPLLAGCKAEAPKLTEKESQNFKGGPMPEDVRRAMEENNRRIQQNPPSAGGPPPAAAPPGPPKTP
jgi:hypothetical protein